MRNLAYANFWQARWLAGAGFEQVCSYTPSRSCRPACIDSSASARHSSTSFIAFRFSINLLLLSVVLMHCTCSWCAGARRSPTPCIGCYGAGAGICSPPRTPYIYS